MNKLVVVGVLGGAVAGWIASPPMSEALDGPRPVYARLMAPGDSLRYTLTWGSARGATGYRVVVTPTAWNTLGWTGLPASQIVTGTSLVFTAINTAWDSVQFRAEVYSRQNNREHPTPSFVVWSVRRLGPPGPITVDSSLVISGINLVPDAVTLVAGQDTATFCALLKFRDGAVAFRSTSPAAYCDSAARASGGVPSVAQQFLTDTTCFTFRTVGDSGKASTNQALCESPARISYSAN